MPKATELYVEIGAYRKGSDALGNQGEGPVRPMLVLSGDLDALKKLETHFKAAGWQEPERAAHTKVANIHTVEINSMRRLMLNFASVEEAKTMCEEVASKFGVSFRRRFFDEKRLDESPPQNPTVDEAISVNDLVPLFQKEISETEGLVKKGRAV